MGLWLCVLVWPAPAVAQQGATGARGSTPAGDGFQEDTTPLPPEVTGATDPDAPGTGGTAAVTGGGSSLGPIVRLVVGLAVVLGVVYGLYWLLRAHARGKGRLVSDDRLKVVAATALGPNRALHLVKIADELVLVGVAEGSVTPVRVWPAAEARRLESALALEVSAAPFRPAGDGGGARLLEELRKRTTRS